MVDTKQRQEIIQVPLWTMVSRDKLQASGLGLSVLVFTAPEFGDFITLFTTNQKAIEFRDEMQIPGAAIVELKTMDAVKHIVSGWHKSGVSHVGLNVFFRDGSPNGQFYPSTEILAAFGTGA